MHACTSSFPRLSSCNRVETPLANLFRRPPPSVAGFVSVSKRVGMNYSGAGENA